MSWPSFFSLYHQPHQCITSVLSCLLSCWEHFSLPCPAIPQVLSCHFLSETVNTCSPSSGDPEQFSPQNPQHVLCNVLVGPQSISAWRDFCGLPHCTDKPSGMERGHPSLTITHVWSVLLSASGSTVSPLEPYPAPSGPLLTSILTPPFSCKGPATSQMERPLTQKSTLSPLAGNVGQVKSLVRVPIY